jgi:hypothetical protein
MGREARRGGGSKMASVRRTRAVSFDFLIINTCCLDEEHDRCFCADCAARARIPDVLDAGTDHPYEVPKGWCGFARKLPPKTVLREGSLLMPGDTLIDGSKLPHRLTQGGDERIQIYSSPSIKYSVFDIYTAAQCVARAYSARSAPVPAITRVLHLRRDDWLDEEVWIHVHFPAFPK